ncbi:MAG: response regulator [Syntrophobacterales bacterium]|jgi:DNA-binding response OmpR family regulator
MGAKVLVADDEHQIRDLLNAFLTNEAYEVILASDGKEAIELAGRENPDVILLDLKMPEINGIEACQRLKAEPKTQFIPVIVITGYVDNKIHAIEVGADDFVNKPINLTELAFRVKSILRTRHITDELERAVAYIGELEKDSTALTKVDLGEIATGERFMEAFIEWETCTRGIWCNLSELDLDHEHFNDMEGIYVIWQGVDNPLALRVGHGLIKECLARERNDKEVLAYQRDEIYVTWGKVDRKFCAAIVRYIANILQPELDSSSPDVEPLKVNIPSPWYEESFPWE